MNPIDPDLLRLFALLDRFRHLPAYRLEPRADPFFALYMPAVISRRVGADLHSIMIPELPLRWGTLRGEDLPGANQSVKVDYALFSADRKRAFLVELKTDQGSLRESQDAYLRASVTAGFRNIINGVLKVVLATSTEYVQKYLHLLHTLSALEFVRVPSSVYEHAYPEPRRGLTAELRRVENLVAEGAVGVEVLYVQPVATAGNTIGFDEFASIAEGSGRLGQLFAESLRAWKEPAGARDPRQRDA